VDPRTLSWASRYIYTGFTDPQRPYDRERAGPRAPATVPNSYGRFDLQTRAIDRYFVGKTHGLQECTFVPRGSAEGQGYLIGVASNYAEMRSELVIADAEHLSDGDVARVILPFRLSAQVHGTWVGRDELPLV
jgi:carotenoid cleavage dioxygenase